LALFGSDWNCRLVREMYHRLAAVAIVAAFFAVTPAQASLLPSPSEFITPSEQSLFGDAVRAQMAGKEGDKTASLAILDSVLAREVEPTKFRGFVQMLRSDLLLDAERSEEAIAAADEAVRLLPGYSGPLLLAMHAYAYSSRAGEGADYLIRASEIDPEIVRTLLDDYEVFSLLHRLDAANDERRLGSVSDRLLVIGWRGHKLDSRSKLASDAIPRRLRNGDMAGAHSLIPELLVPADTYGMLASNRYRALWPDLEKWAGPKLERQWQLYLTEARSRWNASHDTESADAYLSALLSAGRYQDVVTDILPIFNGDLDKVRDYDLIYRVSGVASALGALGRWDDVRKLYATAERTWPLGSDVNALNLTGNEAKYALAMGEPQRALGLLDRTIAEAERHRDGINADAFVQMHLYRTCALHALGRDSEAAGSLALAATTTTVENSVQLRLCIGDDAGAREAMLRALADDSKRDDAIAVLQKPGTPPLKSAYDEQMEKRWNALRTDPRILAELAKYGRLLPFTLNEAAQFAPEPKVPESKTSNPGPVT